MKETQSYIKEHKQRFLDELIELLKIPSISTDSAYSKYMHTMSEILASDLKKIGLNNVEVYKTKGNPVVFGEKIINKNLPTILVYGHYDVQPPDPLELWENPPFEPVIKKTETHPDGAIFARGSADDKGQVFMHFKAIEAMLETNSLPCNVKIIVEGEEEIGSKNLPEFLKENKEKLSCNIVLISDTHIFSNEVPTVCVGLRGLSCVEVSVEGSNRDLHSGIYGGAVPNPINVLAKMIADLHDENGKITIPGFYDKVELLTEKEKKELDKLPFNEEDYKKSIGLKGVHGEKGFNSVERSSTRPTLDVNGIWGGYSGEGTKTVIPSKAYAKFSMRIVPYQETNEIIELFSKHILNIAPESVKVTVTPHHGGNPYVLLSNDLSYKAAKKAMEKTFNKEVLPYRAGASVPITSIFEEILGSKSVLMGFGLESDAIHSPNEHFGLFNFYKGIETIPYFFQYYTEEK